MNVLREKNWCLTGFDKDDLAVLSVVAGFAIVDTIITGTFIYYFIK